MVKADDILRPAGVRIDFSRARSLSFFLRPPHAHTCRFCLRNMHKAVGGVNNGGVNSVATRVAGETGGQTPKAKEAGDVGEPDG